MTWEAVTPCAYGFAAFDFRPSAVSYSAREGADGEAQPASAPSASSPFVALRVGDLVQVVERHSNGEWLRAYVLDRLRHNDAEGEQLLDERWPARLGVIPTNHVYLRNDGENGGNAALLAAALRRYDEEEALPVRICFGRENESGASTDQTFCSSSCPSRALQVMM